MLIRAGFEPPERGNRALGIGMFPNGLAQQNLCQIGDLCTKREDLPIGPNRSCYKTNSGAKSLNLNDLRDCSFSGQLSQPVDFPGLRRQRTRTINKVIHIIRVGLVNLIQIKDLSGVSEIYLNTGA